MIVNGAQMTIVRASRVSACCGGRVAGPDGSGQIEHRVGGQPVLDHIVGTAGVGQFGFGVARFGPRD